MTILKMFCAWCGDSMGEKDGGGVEGDSHGICKKCAAKEMEKIRNYYRTVRASERGYPRIVRGD